MRNPVTSGYTVAYPKTPASDVDRLLMNDKADRFVIDPDSVPHMDR